jgi:cell division control protein 7
MDEHFDIHEDARTEETEMMVEGGQIEDVDAAEMAHINPEEEEEEQEVEEEEEECDDDDDGSSDDDVLDRSVKADMEKLQRDFPGFRDKYRLIKRIGEGLFSASFLFRICPEIV